MPMDPIRMLRELVALPSVNPAFLPAGDPLGGEERATAWLAALADRWGLGVERQSVLPGRDNLWVRLEPSGRRRQRVILAPHLDTVAAMPKQLRPVRRDGRLYGRGACDTKGSVAAMFSALGEVARRGRRPANTEVLFTALVDEEHAQSGSRALAAVRLEADLAIVGEPTRLQVITAHKGDVWLQLETRGKAAHGARPELGRNAVLEMARVVEAIETEYAAMLRQQHHPLLGRATVNVGSIAGGTQPNIVPDRCRITVDRRTLPGESVASVVREVRALLRLQGLRATVADHKGAPCWPLETDPDLPFVRRFMDGVGQRRPRGVQFFCDASVLGHGGIPSVVFGPGDIAQAHTADEWVALREVEQATEVLTGFLRSLP